MIKCNDWPISVCSWSLANDFDKLDILREKTGLSHISLALAPALDGDEGYLAKVRADGWQISSTMVHFPQENYTTLESIKATGGIVPERGD